MSDDKKLLTDKFALRLPEGMRDQLSRIADANKRSTNAEIIARLEWSLEEEAKGATGVLVERGGGGAVADLQRQIDKIMRILAANNLTDPDAPAIVEEERATPDLLQGGSGPLLTRR